MLFLDGAVFTCQFTLSHLVFFEWEFLVSVSLQSVSLQPYRDPLELQLRLGLCITGPISSG